MSRIIAITVFVLILSWRALHAQTLHVVGVFDVSARGIGDSVRMDQEAIQRSFGHAVFSEKVEFTLLNSNLTPESVIEAAVTRSVKEGDAYLFYFSGHGRAAADFANGPEMMVGDDAISRVKIWERLERKYGTTARLIAVISDCCYSATNLGGPCAAADAKGDALLRSLFLECPAGTRIDLNSCLPRQVALSRGGMSSCFTDSFSSALDLNSEKSLTWAQFLAEVRESTASLAEQHIMRANEKGVDLGAKELNRGADLQQRSQTIYLVPSRSRIIGDAFGGVRFGVYPVMTSKAVSIDSVVEGSVGSRLMQRGDRVLTINGESVTSPEQMTRLVNNSGKNMEIYYMRSGKRIGVTAILPW